MTPPENPSNNENGELGGPEPASEFEEEPKVPEEDYLTERDPAFFPTPWYRKTRTRRHAGLAARLVLILFLLIPFIDFVRVSVGRMYYDFEIEWLEGEVAIYSVRWQEARSIAHLYPEYQTSRYTPHLYAPLYQITVAELQALFGGELLGMGRLVSFLSTLALMGAVVLIVRDATRSWFAGFAGALVYTMFFKASGYWYDLMRVDSLAYALAMWSAYLLTRRRGGWVSVGGGIILAFLALFTKQTAVFIPVLAMVVRVTLSLLQLFCASRDKPAWRLFPLRTPVYKNALAPLALIVLVPVILANLIYFVKQGVWGEAGFYIYEVGKGHPIFYGTILNFGGQQLWQYYAFLAWLPALALWAYPWLRRWRHGHHAVFAGIAGLGVFSLAAHMLIAISEHGAALDPGRIDSFLSGDAMALVIASWTWPMRWAAALMMGGMAVVVLRWFLYRTPMRGAWWFGTLFAAVHIAAVTWVKIGGYINNFMPLFAVQAVVAGLSMAWLFRALERRGGALGSLVGCVAVLPILWLAWFGTRDWLIARDPSIQVARAPVEKLSPEQFRAAPVWITDGLRYNKDAITTSGKGDGEKEEIRIVQPAEPLGLQVPTKEAEEWGHKLLDRLRELGEQGTVYLPHQNYLGHLAGLEIRNSVDSIRDINGPAPRPLMEGLREKRYNYIVLMNHLEYDWLPKDMKEAIGANYERAGPLMPDAPPDAYRPRTGAMVRPEWLYRAKE